ncbi:MAG: ABC transporter ATP-binding protein [Thermodesulfovibrionales bacterium]|nr:ABC transporter ATP-binding protein [Thermodesulfovibrionales bacterium]
MEVFNVKKISYAYKNGKKAVDEVSFSVKKGESLTIIGTNGSGKSTLLYLLNGLLTPESGDIEIFGRNINGNFPPELRQRIALLFQNPQAQLFLLSVWDELCFGPLQLGLEKNEIQKRTEELLGLLNIKHLRDRGPWDLSGGEMRKVAFGTCLSVNPDVLLLDEPTTGLDPRSQVEFVDLINELRHAGKTIVTATHDLGIIEDISDRTVVIGEDHRLLTEGNPWDVMEDTDMLLRANLIHRHVHRHCWYAHEHSHFGTHGHEHIQVDNKQPQVESQAIKEVILGMTELDKLKKLLEHWSEHNEEHAKTYLEWAEKASASGDKELSAVLKEIAENTKKMDGLFEKAKKAVRK